MAFILDHPKVAAGLSISGVFELAPLRDSPQAVRGRRRCTLGAMFLGARRRGYIWRAFQLCGHKSQLTCASAQGNQLGIGDKESARLARSFRPRLMRNSSPAAAPAL
jgi:hypothetical protein